MRPALPLALLLLAGTAAAAVELLGNPPSPRQVASGRAVAAGAGGQGQQGACFACHGFDGAGQAAAGFPALAGQSAEYLHEQLERYASGARPNPIMQPIAAAMTPDQRRDVSVYYAAQPPQASAGARPQGDPALLQHGGNLSAIGSAERGVQACQNCHGPGGIGLWPNYPRLAGQPADYLAAQLRAWKQGERPGDEPYNFMANIAARLTEDDIRAVSLYFASVRTVPRQAGTGVLP
ncbi:c-type cytochrome [Falsiroseomonas tokyonensis]|uniref:C-type cytochrome n=1 Tax=Falsiroseomonas tokyonensis TaxID=430521 RepID=A0ABV7BPU3_9PROT|nr:c-type cytochrome [Falsiroseomonas tokyonensis]MBU8536591.1 c-type cytochrome [Falsiroseomonas tokyonensis]